MTEHNMTNPLLDRIDTASLASKQIDQIGALLHVIKKERGHGNNRLADLLMELAQSLCETWRDDFERDSKEAQQRHDQTGPSKNTGSYCPWF